LAACAAIACAAIGVAPAAAAPLTRWDPQDSNVPYLAWRGERQRLVACIPAIGVDTDWMGRKRAGYHQKFEWIIENWSDDSFERPSIVPGSAGFFVGTGEHKGEGCVKATFGSNFDGLAQIQLVVSPIPTIPIDPTPDTCPFKKHFLAGWLNLDSASIRELSANTGPGSLPGGGGILGDPSGDGDFSAGDPPGRVQAQIVGTLPLGPNWSTLRDLGGKAYPSAIHLPTEANGSTYWDDLAHSLAATDNAAYANTPWQTWDIHDDRTRAAGHITGSICGGPFAALEGVDSCMGAAVFGGDGQYSQAFGTLSAAPTIGPFDALRPAETLLSDGKVDEGDVPMPAVLLEFFIKANAGGSDTGGIGALAVENPDAPAGAPALARWQGVDKCIAYTRDNRCTSSSGSHPATVPNVAAAPFGPAAGGCRRRVPASARS
jgi:hypothetical protein